MDVNENTEDVVNDIVMRGIYLHILFANIIITL